METEPTSTLPSDESEEEDLTWLIDALSEHKEMHESVRPTFTVCGKTFETEDEAGLFLIQEQRRAKARILLEKPLPDWKKAHRSSGHFVYTETTLSEELIAAMQADPATFRQILDVLDPEQEVL